MVSLVHQGGALLAHAAARAHSRHQHHPAAAAAADADATAAAAGVAWLWAVQLLITAVQRAAAAVHRAAGLCDAPAVWRVEDADGGAALVGAAAVGALLQRGRG